MLPSFFFTNNTGAPHGETLGLMNPRSRSSCNCSFNSFNSNGAIRYGALEIGSAPGTRSIVNSTSRSGGNLRSSSGKTSE
ncbi:hypothetical protein HanHA300_Chr16g0621591 [Helianthus annuus]|nr:hypothetical protein HanHA300_Chr16g0621591 [Helianthus annuus]KAJ0461459.1 hypothetical protein HanHA89_Chr16g0672491 [Helianthus annuus]